MDNKSVLTSDERQGPAAMQTPATKTINDFIAAEMPETHGVRETPPVTQSSESEPHGMYWGEDGRLRPHQWFIEQIVATADEVFSMARDRWSTDEESKELVNALSLSLRDYVETRTAINSYAGPRKIKQEMDDACYQLAQSAKFYIDATEKAQWSIARGVSIDDNPQIAKLMEMSRQSAREGFILAQAVVAAAPGKALMEIRPSAVRVAEFSCRKLTEWYATRRTNLTAQERMNKISAALEISKFFTKGAR